jgi:hypothetical protein
MQKQFNAQPNVFCLALTFNSNWEEILDYKAAAAAGHRPIKFQYAVNIVARIISMNYHISLDETNDLLLNVIGNLIIKSSTPSDLIHECVKYIIAQHRANGHEIDQFVLVVDESVVIQERLDPEGKLDIHLTLRNCLLTRPMIMDDNLHLKVDLIMSGLVKILLNK